MADTQTTTTLAISCLENLNDFGNVMLHIFDIRHRPRLGALRCLQRAREEHMRGGNYGLINGDGATSVLPQFADLHPKTLEGEENGSRDDDGRLWRDPS